MSTEPIKRFDLEFVDEDTLEMVERSDGDWVEWDKVKPLIDRIAEPAALSAQVESRDCNRCDGTGWDNGSQDTCHACKGRGKVEQIHTGADLIVAERLRQISQEGWTPEHDDKHSSGELADAADSYLSAGRTIARWGSDELTLESMTPPLSWPWDFDGWKPSPDPIRNLVKAGALIAAEIDRLRRKLERLYSKVDEAQSGQQSPVPPSPEVVNYRGHKEWCPTADKPEQPCHCGAGYVARDAIPPSPPRAGELTRMVCKTCGGRAKPTNAMFPPTWRHDETDDTAILCDRNGYEIEAVPQSELPRPVPPSPEGGEREAREWMRTQSSPFTISDWCKIPHMLSAYASDLRQQLASEKAESERTRTLWKSLMRECGEENCHVHAVENIHALRRERDEARKKNNALHITAENLSTSLGAERMICLEQRNRADDAEATVARQAEALEKAWSALVSSRAALHYVDPGYYDIVPVQDLVSRAIGDIDSLKSAPVTQGEKRQEVTAKCTCLADGSGKCKYPFALPDVPDSTKAAPVTQGKEQGNA